MTHQMRLISTNKANREEKGDPIHINVEAIQTIQDRPVHPGSIITLTDGSVVIATDTVLQLINKIQRG